MLQGSRPNPRQTGSGEAKDASGYSTHPRVRCRVLALLNGKSLFRTQKRCVATFLHERAALKLVRLPRPRHP
jgi:hypothetical protein